jgi:hypothetical protein
MNGEFKKRLCRYNTRIIVKQLPRKSVSYLETFMGNSSEPRVFKVRNAKINA